jgi:hypothetical protein
MIKRDLRIAFFHENVYILYVLKMLQYLLTKYCT